MSAMYTTDCEIVLRRLESECLLTLRLSATGVPVRLSLRFWVVLRYGDLQKAESAGPKIPPASPKDQRLLSIAILNTQQHQAS